MERDVTFGGAAIAETIRALAGADLKLPSSAAELLESQGVIQWRDFQQWSTFGSLWTHLLPERNDCLWLDIVLHDPVGDRFVYTAVYKGRHPGVFENFKTIQKEADTDFYRKEVTSLSRLFVEGVISWEKRRPIVVLRCIHDSWEFQVSPSGYGSPITVVTMKQPGLNQDINQGLVNEVWVGLGNRVSKATGFDAVFDKMRGFADAKLDSSALARYFVWLAYLPKWKTYLYFPLPGFTRKTGALVFAFSEELTNSAIHQFCGALEPKAAVLALLVARAASASVHGLARKAAEAAVMARNMSHNLGSHALVKINAELLQGRVPESVELVGYVQQRMDFVARVAVDWPTWWQPLFFFRDVVAPFKAQTLLLDLLVADDGYNGENIHFQIAVARGDSPFEWQAWDQSSEAPPVVDDPLIGLPGGVIGRQALYGLLENAMRNAARHNKPPAPAGLTIYLGVREQDDHYDLLYADSVSEIDDNRLSAIRGIVEEPLTGADGSVAGAHWGTHEMKVCARFLAYDGRAESRAIERLQADRVPVPTEGSGTNKVLSYWLRLQKPSLVCLLDFGDQNDTPSDGLNSSICKRLGVRYLRAAGQELNSSGDTLLDEVRRIAPHLLCIRSTASSSPAVRGWLHSYAHRLPARILLADGGSPDAGGYVALNGDQFLPPNRNQEDVERWILALYKAWIVGLASQRRALPLHLVVHINDEDSPLKKRWSAVRENFQRATGTDSALQVDIAGAVEEVPRSGTALVLRDHDENPGTLQLQNVLFWQTWGIGFRQAKIAVENPPQGFGGLFWLLEAFEAGLLRVLVIDERVAEKVFEARENAIALSRMGILRAFAGIVVVPAIEIRGKLRSLREEWEGLTFGKDGFVGLRLDDNGLAGAPLYGFIGGKLTRYDFLQSGPFGAPPFDVAVIHRTQLDRFSAQDAKTLIQSLKERLARRVVITSGRGSLLARDPFRDWPFVDFSAIDSCVIRDLWKVGLVAPLMAAL